MISSNKTISLAIPAAVIACENAVMATNTLKGLIEQGLTEETKSKLDKVARFANSAVDHNLFTGT